MQTHVDHLELSVTDQLAFLARRASDHAFPVLFSVAAGEEQRREVFRLRYQAVVDRGWRSPDDFPDGLEFDDDDRDAILIVGRAGETPVAGARLILPNSNRFLPIERTFDLLVDRRHRTAHLDRLTVLHSFSDTASRTLRGLIGFCWLEVLNRGLQSVVGIESEAMIRLYRRQGLEMQILGPARTYWNEFRYPVRFDPHTSVMNHMKRLQK